MLVRKADGSLTRFGILAGEAFEPDGSDNIEAAQDEFVIESQSCPESFSLSLETSVFHSGANPATEFTDCYCWSFRSALIDRLGAEIGESNYRPEYDLDLDGDIDADDVAILNTLNCNADCECDGDVDEFDLLCFQSLYAADDPSADIKGDGDLDYFDFLAFQQAAQAGCTGCQ